MKETVNVTCNGLDGSYLLAQLASLGLSQDGRQAQLFWGAVPLHSGSVGFAILTNFSSVSPQQTGCSAALLESTTVKPDGTPGVTSCVEDFKIKPCSAAWCKVFVFCFSNFFK